MSAEPTSLYVHVPFCKTRCTYCAFNTYAGLEALFEPYLRALEREICLVGQAAVGLNGHTLYFGGGTPSLLAPAQVETIIAACRAHLGLTPDAEISLEANPGTVDASRLAAFRALGVNRLSIGVQSAHARELKLFGRGHTFAEAAEAFRLARRAGFDNLNVDLIYGLPYQTRRLWRETLDAVLAWEPDHVALYGLTLEPGTSLHHRAERGLVPTPDPDLAADMYDDARERLDRWGFRHYEISNWARPGYECQHNRQYWLNRPYLGFGPGAHGWAGGLRYWNVDPVPEYIARLSGGQPREFPLSPAVQDYEVIEPPLAMAESMILGLRLVRDGVSRADFTRRYGRSPDSLYGPLIADLSQGGLLTSEADRLRLTERAYLISNRVFAQFLP